MYSIIVMTNQPLRKTLYKPEASGLLVKWLVELSEFDITYKPRAAIKVQALVDFVAKCIEGDKEAGSGKLATNDSKASRVYLASVKGSSGYKEAGAGA